jgi:hypothetical protein
VIRVNMLNYLKYKNLTLKSFKYFRNHTIKKVFFYLKVKRNIFESLIALLSIINYLLYVEVNQANLGWSFKTLKKSFV